MNFPLGKRTKQFIGKPLQLVTLPYRRWHEQKEFEQALRDEQNQIAREASDQLATAHKLLWSRWSEVMTYVRDNTQRKDTTCEHEK